MKVKKYVVLWHEDNEHGSTRHVMGASEPFDTREEADAWIRNTVQEDRERHKESKRREAFAEIAGLGVWITKGNDQTTFYHVEEIVLGNKAAECIEEVKGILKDFKREPKTGRDELQVVKRALACIEEHEREWLPMRRWDVDIVFSPAGCVHSVLARTADEARGIVEDMLDKEGTNMFTSEQKSEMMDSLIENVESIEVLGPRED